MFYIVPFVLFEYQMKTFKIRIEKWNKIEIDINFRLETSPLGRSTLECIFTLSSSLSLDLSSLSISLLESSLTTSTNRRKR